MALIPMYSVVGREGWHQNLAPGGYEGWRVVYSDQGMQVVVSLMTGSGLQEKYMGEFRRYMKRPTRVAPPLPPRWPGAHLVVIREGKVIGETLTEFPGEVFMASRGSLDVTMGLNRLAKTAEGVLQLSVRGKPLVHGRFGSRHPAGLIALDLTLYTISQATGMKGIFGGEHLWRVVAGPCTAKGQVAIRMGKGTEVLPLAGRACVEHELGTGPIEREFGVWMRGAAFMERGVVPIRVVMENAGKAGVAYFDGLNEFVVAEEARVGWAGDAKRRYPSYVEAGERLRMDMPVVIDEKGPVVTVEYRVKMLEGVGKAICQVENAGRRVGKMFLKPRGRVVREASGPESRG